MATECLGRQIERPSRLCGYRPTNWCAVCGRKINPETAKQCVVENCVNLCHQHCLGEAAEYTCGNTGLLRTTVGINDAVTFYSKTAQAVPDPPPLTNNYYEEDEDDDLRDLQRDELVKLVRNLRHNLASTKAQLSHYRFVTSDLADKRQYFVESLGIIDTLLTTHACDGINQKSVACTAKPHKVISEDANIPPLVDNGNREEEHAASVLPPSPPPPTRADPPPHQVNIIRECTSPTLPPSNILPHQPAPPHLTPDTGEMSDDGSASGGDSPMVESDSESDAEHLTHHTTYQAERRLHQSQRKTAAGATAAAAARRNNSPVTAAEPGPTHPGQWEEARPNPRGPAHPRRQQPRCPKCKRLGHTRDRCPRTTCDYCQGRAHTSLQCRVKMADRKQQELVEAMRKNGQDTISALRNVFWQIQQPGSLQSQVRSYQTAPWGPLIPQTFWPSPPPAPTLQHPPGLFPGHI